tara:strand:+ start:954 stop:1814 length:861 start_codon:yes stop_codon:yes gene_type:complete
MPRTVTSKVHLQISAREAWRARSSLELETHIATLGRRKLTLLKEEWVNEGAGDAHQRRLVRCELMSDFLGGSIMGVKTADLGSEVTSTHFEHLYDEAHGAEFSVALALKRVGLSISGRQWCLPESETSCFLCTRVHLEAKIMGLGGLIEMQVERQMRASYEAFPDHAYTYLAGVGALPVSPPSPSLVTVTEDAPASKLQTPELLALPEDHASVDPTLHRLWLLKTAVARGLQSTSFGRTSRRHAVLPSSNALPGDRVPVRIKRRHARVLLWCGCASAIVDSDEIVE